MSKFQLSISWTEFKIYIRWNLWSSLALTFNCSWISSLRFNIWDEDSPEYILSMKRPVLIAFATDLSEGTSFCVLFWKLRSASQRLNHFNLWGFCECWGQPFSHICANLFPHFWGTYCHSGNVILCLSLHSLFPLDCKNCFNMLQFTKKYSWFDTILF